MGREGNTLSAVIVKHWDDGDLSPLTRNNPMTSTGAHVSIVGHITQQKLLARMNDASKAKRLSNGFLSAVVKRSKKMPEGTDVPEDILQELADRLTEAVTFARKGGTVGATTRHGRIGRKLRAAGEGRPGLTGAILSRAERRYYDFVFICAPRLHLYRFHQAPGRSACL